MLSGPMKRAAVPGLLLLLLLPAGVVAAGTAVPPKTPPQSANQGNHPAPAALLTPDGKSGEKGEHKNCMTVCARWGKECTYVNRGAGGTTKKCRRACKQFSQECF